jgi:hypothetical protein
VSPDGVFDDGPWLKGDDVYVAGHIKNVGDELDELWLFPANGAAPKSVSSNAFKGYLNQHPLLMGTGTYALIDPSTNKLFGNFEYSSSGTTYEGILTINLTSGAVEKMVDTPLSGMQRGAPFAMDSTHVYWADSIALHRRSLSGGTIEDLPTPDIKYDIVAMASDATALYLAAEYDVFRYDKAGGKVTPVLKTLYRVRQVTVSDKTVYASDVARTGCSDPQSPGSVWAAPKNGTSGAATKRLVKSNNNVVSLSASLSGSGASDRVVWFDECTGDVHSVSSTGDDRILSKGTGSDNGAVVAKASKATYWQTGNKLWKLAD